MAIAELDARREALRALRCRTGHALELVSCDIGTQLCDRCQRRIDCSFTYRCRSCDFDLCERCFSTAKKAYWRATQEGRPVSAGRKAEAVPKPSPCGDVLSYGGRQKRSPLVAPALCTSLGLKPIRGSQPRAQEPMLPPPAEVEALTSRLTLPATREDHEEALRNLSPLDRFRLAASLLVVQQMACPSAPKLKRQSRPS
mmetsp:Transcript_7831/g.18671  ORF Transcript_7831/g.18671 Transcript_7831/m.18671 type:complete len:199 (-) Transcript_7831:16-612(-)